MRAPRVGAAAFLLALALLFWSNSPLVGTGVASTTGQEQPATASSGSVHQGQPAAASNGSVHLVVWSEQQVSGQPRDLRGARLNGSGKAIGSSFAITASPGWDLLPQVAWDGKNFIVAWYRTSGEKVDLLVTRVNTEGSVLDTSGVLVATNIQFTHSPPALASGGVSSLVAWFDSLGAVRSSRISRAGVVLDQGGRQVGSTPLPSYSWSVSTAWHESRYLVVWNTGQPFVNYAIFANRIDGATGSALDGPGVPIAVGPGPRYFPRVAGGPGGFLVVWTDGRASTDSLYPFLVLRGSLRGPADYDLYGARVSDAGIVLDPNGMVIAPGQGAQLWPSLAHIGGRWLVTLEDRGPTGPARAAMTWVASLPSATSATPVDVSSTASQTAPALSADASGRALVVWEDGRCGYRCSQIRGAFVTVSGATQLGVIG